MKVIHFITDEKFLNDTIDMFEDINELNNRYIMIVFGEDKPFEYITSDKVEKIDISEINKIITNPNLCDVIVIHNLSSLPCELIKEINKKIKVVWFSWGFDTYSNKFPQFPLIKLKNRIKPKTINLRYRIRLLHDSSRRITKELYKNKLKGRNYFKEAIQRIDYYSGVFPEEYDLIKKNSFFHAKQVYFNYAPSGQYNIEDIKTNIHPSANNIQVGQSSSSLANHRNTFWIIRNLNLHNRKIIVPLSYNGDSLYKSTVTKMGYKLFGNNFQPLTTFLPKLKYQAIIKTISIAIFNLEQQSAVGNIIYNLWNGAKVFVPESSLNYKHFSNLGFHIFSIEKDLNQKEIDTPLSEKNIIMNRKLVIQHYSYEAIKNRTKNSFLNIIK